ncbi:hypothetical protein CYMTET_57045 [Cymbomonas tetramitiformis]|uniref:Uncharacterized protein n=1 Tax=Cymbomonas tetramitiformis TaxID=36881 RepID=A0AAE0BB18_9CHLO|nr:hypothetical protein CYMTET_57045 [Cymbomonas tetramitiformis]
MTDPAQRARLRWTAVGIVGKQAGPREVEAEAGLVLGIQSASTLEPSAVGGPAVIPSVCMPSDAPGCIHSTGLGGTLMWDDGSREIPLCTLWDVTLHLCSDFSSDSLHDAATQRGQTESHSRWSCEVKPSAVEVTAVAPALLYVTGPSTMASSTPDGTGLHCVG